MSSWVARVCDAFLGVQRILFDFGLPADQNKSTIVLSGLKDFRFIHLSQSMTMDNLQQCHNKRSARLKQESAGRRCPSPVNHLGSARLRVYLVRFVCRWL